VVLPGAPARRGCPSAGGGRLGARARRPRGGPDGAGPGRPGRGAGPRPVRVGDRTRRPPARRAQPGPRDPGRRRGPRRPCPGLGMDGSGCHRPSAPPVPRPRPGAGLARGAPPGRDDALGTPLLAGSPGGGHRPHRRGRIPSGGRLRRTHDPRADGQRRRGRWRHRRRSPASPPADLRVRGQERLGRPRRPAFLLRPGELLEAFHRPPLRVVAYEDGSTVGPPRRCSNGSAPWRGTERSRPRPSRPPDPHRDKVAGC